MQANETEPCVHSSHAVDHIHVQNQMRGLPGGPEPLLRSQSPERSEDPRQGGADTSSAPTPTSYPSPSDPSRQAKRLPIRIVKMLTAHSGHLLHPEYLQPLTSAPVSIEVSEKDRNVKLSQVVLEPLDEFVLSSSLSIFFF